MFLLEGPSSNRGRGRGRGRGNAPRKDRDDKVHDSIIEERIQRERPCRTLFIRNIKVSFIANRAGFLQQKNFLSYLSKD